MSIHMHCIHNVSLLSKCILNLIHFLVICVYNILATRQWYLADITSKRKIDSIFNEGNCIKYWVACKYWSIFFYLQNFQLNILIQLICDTSRWLYVRKFKLLKILLKMRWLKVVIGIHKSIVQLSTNYLLFREKKNKNNWKIDFTKNYIMNETHKQEIKSPTFQNFSLYLKSG